jgi:hypothetical protein
MAQASELSFPVVFNTENCAVHSGNPIVSSVYLPTPLWHQVKALNRTDIKNDKPDEKSMLCQRTFSSVFTQLNCTVQLIVMGLLGFAPKSV